jgi:hypothetical protein
MSRTTGGGERDALGEQGETNVMAKKAAKSAGKPAKKSAAKPAKKSSKKASAAKPAKRSGSSATMKTTNKTNETLRALAADLKGMMKGVVKPKGGLKRIPKPPSAR